MDKPSEKDQPDRPEILDETMIQLVISHIGEQDFAAPIHQVSEVLRHTHITPIPDAPSFIAGISSFHGEMAVVIDLARYFALTDQPNDQAKHIVVIRHGKELYGLLVDEVTQILRIPESAIKAAPELIYQMNSDYISGVYTENENRLIMVFNLDAILSEDELMMIGQVKQKHMGDAGEASPEQSHSKPQEKT